MTIPKVRVRARKPKTKTGCKTCRARRIKCDEEKPSCRKCTYTGRKCDGYEEANKPTEDLIHRHAAVSLGTTTFDAIVSHMSSPLGLNDEESVGFDFFRRKTAVEIQGCFRSSLWESLILQITQHEPSVLHAAIAVGCAHRKLAHRSCTSQAPDVLDQRQFFGLKQYLTAINFLRNRINNKEDPETSQIALITCLLFICHEMLRGQRVGAISHLATGLRILSSRPSRNLIQSQTSIILYHDSDKLQDQLLSLFARLDYDSTMFGQRSPLLSLYPPQTSRTRDIIIPSKLADISEARQYLDILSNGTLRFRGKLLELASLAVPNASPDFPTQLLWEHATIRTLDLTSHTPLLIEMRRLQDGLAVWSAAFKDFQASLDPLQREKNSAALMLLEIQYFYPYFLIATCQTTKEKYCDSFNTLFDRIVTLASSYIENTTSSAQPLFTLDSGVIPALYLVSVKCRQRAIRRQAISLLRLSTCQEGMWEGGLIAGYVERIADLEEARALRENYFGKDGEMSEEARFCGVILATTDDPARGRLVCARYCHEISGELMLWDEFFSLKE